MDFSHTQERQMLADSLNRFLADKYSFNARQMGAYSKTGFSREAWTRFVELGAVDAMFEESEGGLGGAAFDILVVFEAVGRGLVVEPFLVTLLVGKLLAGSGNEQHRSIFDALRNGCLVPTLAFLEPESGYAFEHVRTVARRNERGWSISGEKCAALHGSEADLVLVSARTSGSTNDSEGISLFLVSGSATGLTKNGFANADGGRSADLRFDNVSVGHNELVGIEGRASDALGGAVAYGLLALCAEAAGAIDTTIKATIDYLGSRKQFGARIGSFQAIQHRMATLSLEVEQARSSLINASAAFESEPPIRDAALSAAKLTFGRIGRLVAEECVQLHGAIGMTWELPLAHYAKRLVMIEHQLGDEDFHLRNYIALRAAQSETAPG